ncbi:MAG: hypothetical protein ACTSUE_12005 [Promethearchaeota archaeon]
MSDMKKELEKFLIDESVEKWEQLPVDGYPGVSVAKMPATKTRPSKLSLVINPQKDGKPMKRKGLFITSVEMLLEFAEMLQNESVYNLMKVIEDINGVSAPAKPKRKLKIE